MSAIPPGLLLPDPGRATHVRDRRTSFDRAAIASRSGRIRRRELAVCRSIAHESERRMSGGYLSLSDSARRNRAESVAALYARGTDDRETLCEALALIGASMRASLAMTPRTVQLIAAAGLARGSMVEMGTGEGKTLVATMPAILHAWRGRGCHVMTSNDYLVRRDVDAMQPLYRALGVNVQAVLHGQTDERRRAGYDADVTYVTPKRACADHVRDGLLRGQERSRAGRLASDMIAAQPLALIQRGVHSAIVDEADALLIDDASTPLLLSEHAPDERTDDDIPIWAHRVARSLVLPEHVALDRDRREVRLTKRGAAVVSQHGALASYEARHEFSRQHAVIDALRALHLYEEGCEYIVRDARVIIVDPSTGRAMPDRAWSRGLHRAIEVKEELSASCPSRVAASMPFQVFFRSYRHLSGMSGTLREESRELRVVFGSSSIVVPPHRPCLRARGADRLFMCAEDRWSAVIDEIRTAVRDRQPILIGTRTVTTSEHLTGLLRELGIAHRTLNAVRHKDEAAIIEHSGRAGTVTIATNMAGRGTDILLDHEARAAGGLRVIVAEANDSARLDRQLLGRAARQGQPGAGLVMASLEDDLFATRTPSARLVAHIMHLTRQSDVRGPLARWAIRAQQRERTARAGRQRAADRDRYERSEDLLAFAPQSG